MQFAINRSIGTHYFYFMIIIIIKRNEKRIANYKSQSKAALPHKLYTYIYFYPDLSEYVGWSSRLQSRLIFILLRRKCLIFNMKGNHLMKRLPGLGDYINCFTDITERNGQPFWLTAIFILQIFIFIIFMNVIIKGFNEKGDK